MNRGNIKTKKNGGVLQVKTILSEQSNDILNYLPTRYDYILTDDAIVRGEKFNCLTLRCSLNSIDQVTPWLEEFQNKSHSKWIFGRCVTEPTRFMFRRQWFCHHSCLNKGKTEKSKSTDCKAKIDLKIKKITCDTKKKDEFLRLKPQFPTIIRLYYDHNHTTEYVLQREALLANFKAVQKEIRTEFIRLQNLISKGKPGLSAMKQFLNQIKNINTESELYEAMRKIRLKPTCFTRLGRPPKNKTETAEPDMFSHDSRINQMISISPGPPEKRARLERRMIRNPTRTTSTATLISLQPGTLLTGEPIELHAVEEIDDEQSSNAIDISYLFTN